MNHTPGPWKVFDNRNDSDVATVSSLIGVTPEDPERPDVAYCLQADWEGLTPKEALANAKLIAAAPELLEALKALMESRRRDQFRGWEEGCPDFHKSEELARAAIAKAESI